ncbi:hypothetical protein ABIB08_008874 [Bradyrhizobium sp. RT11b]
MVKPRKTGSRNGGHQTPFSPRKRKPAASRRRRPRSIAAKNSDSNEYNAVVAHADKSVVVRPDKNSVEIFKTTAEELKRLAPIMGREGLLIVGSIFPAHAAAAVGVNPYFAYGTSLFAIMAYLWRVR